MDPEDKIEYSPGGHSTPYVITYGEPEEYSESSSEVTDGKFTINYQPGGVFWSSTATIDVAANDNNFIVDDIFADSTFGVTPTEKEPTVYTSYEQREQHEKYPALQKAWEDYLAMYALTKGEPPIVD